MDCKSRYDSGLVTMQNELTTTHIGKYEKQIQALLGVTSNPAIGKTPIFHLYYGDSLGSKDAVQRYFTETSIIFDLLEAKGKDVLDIGCGLGLRSIIMSLLGSRKVVGIDISEEMIKAFQTVLKEFPYLDVEAKKGDFLLTDYPSESFDAVILYEAISHIRDTRLLLDKIRDVLRQDGILYVSDGNNDFFLPTRFRARRQWQKAEWGPSDERMAKYGREVDRLCFFDARKKIIQSLCPSIESGTLEMIARKTQGMYGDMITKAVVEFNSTGKIRQKATFPYRNPYTGEFPELTLNPFKLIRALRHRRFRCRFVPRPYSYMGVSPRISIAMMFWQGIGARAISAVQRNSPNSLIPLLDPRINIIATKQDVEKH
jgi:SAM-dependent methyltransferase